MSDLDSLNEQFFDRDQNRDDPERWSSSTPSRGVVTSAHYRASAAGAEILKSGGNAFDAAIATSFALNVCEPAGSGMGGMATMVLFDAKTERLSTLEGPCLAPRASDPEQIAAENRYRGAASVAVPTHVATMHALHQQHASLPLDRLLQPAIAIAEEGFLVTETLSHLMHRYRKGLGKRTAGRFYLQDGQAFNRGEVLRQPVLARTLHTLADRGLEEFYLGEMGQQIVNDIQSGGGFLSQEDFAKLPEPLSRTPICGRWGTDTVHSLAPPGGGMTLIQMVQMFDGLNRETIDFDRGQDVVLLARLIRRARMERKRNRLKFLADAPGDAKRLIDAKYNRALVRKMFPESTSTGETSHVSIVDRWGNAVALTQSIERSFGSCVASPELGFCYNGYLRAFKVVNKLHPYYLRPGLPARSNAAPTIVTRDGKPRIVIGSTGSERMISGIFCTLLRLKQTDPFSASHAPRLHCTPERIVVLEADRFRPSVKKILISNRFQLQDAGPYSFQVGGLQLVVADESGVTGVADPRRDGAAIAG